MICFQISIFAESYTPSMSCFISSSRLWFAFKLVSLQSHIHQVPKGKAILMVVICFQISIFAESYTPPLVRRGKPNQLWFAFKLVSLQSHIHRSYFVCHGASVVICFQISIFAESYTPKTDEGTRHTELWFAFKLVSLQSHIHLSVEARRWCFRCDLLSN